MDTFSMTFGYLCFILALQVVRRRSMTMLPPLVLFAILPLLSLVFDFDGLSGRHETAFTAAFLGALVGHLGLLYLVNRSWAAQAASMHPNGFPTGVTGRERLKFLLAGVALFLVHRQYGRPEVSLYEQLDRSAFWLLLLLAGVSAVLAFFRHRRAIRSTIGGWLAIAVFWGCGAVIAAPAPEARAEELAVLLALSGKAADRHEQWDSSVEPAISEGYPALIALFTVAKRSEEVFLRQVRERVTELGGVPVKVRRIYPEKYNSSRQNLSNAISLLKRERPAVAALVSRGCLSGMGPASQAAAASPKVLGWLHERFLALQSRPEAWSWWTDEYLVCSVCGMPTMQLSTEPCRICGADFLDALRVR
ncbi:MAG TPA: hypothetical protein VIV61_14470 [Candidatus Ozemobacteraceae bacterium]